jgi:hypothetical protein
LRTRSGARQPPLSPSHGSYLPSLLSAFQDLSDDEKPLWDRKAQEERKQRRQAKKAAAAAAAAAAGAASPASPAGPREGPAVPAGAASPDGAAPLLAGERPRRRASAGVAAATQALAAAAGVLIEPAASRDLASPRAPRAGGVRCLCGTSVCIARFGLVRLWRPAFWWPCTIQGTL